MKLVYLLLLTGVSLSGLALCSSSGQSNWRSNAVTIKPTTATIQTAKIPKELLPMPFKHRSKLLA